MGAFPGRRPQCPAPATVSLPPPADKNPADTGIAGLPGVADLEAETARCDHDRQDPGTFSNALPAAVVEVNVRTGAVDILRYLVIEDCGTVVNPMIVEGQLHSGIAQGIGQAPYEHAAYDEEAIRAR